MANKPIGQALQADKRPGWPSSDHRLLPIAHRSLADPKQAVANVGIVDQESPTSIGLISRRVASARKLTDHNVPALLHANCPLDP
jgi:hypothetical protein